VADFKFKKKKKCNGVRVGWGGGTRVVKKEKKIDI
jgi:hypothetical protein